jgi:hypothetical protein
MIGFIFQEHKVVYIANHSTPGEATLDASALHVHEEEGV